MLFGLKKQYDRLCTCKKRQKCIIYCLAIFFNSDKILIKTLFDKLKNSDRDADDLLHKLIITKCIDESNN